MSPKKPKQPRRRPQVLSPKERSQFVKEYGEAVSWGGKKVVCDKYNISEGQATHLVEEHTLGAKKKSWASYTPTQQHEIMQRYVDAPEGGKRQVAFSYGLMTRSISAAVGRAKEKGEAPEPVFQPLHPIANPPSTRDYDRARKGMAFAQGDPEIHTKRRPSRVTEEPAFSARPPGAGDALDEVWQLFKQGQISQEAFNVLIAKLNK